MPLTVAVTDHWTDGKRVIVLGTITSSGNYTTGGDTLSFNLPLIKSASAPEYVQIQGRSATIFNLYKYIPGAPPTISNGKMVGYSGSTQFTTGVAYPADSIVFYAVFPKFQ